MRKKCFEKTIHYREKRLEWQNLRLIRRLTDSDIWGGAPILINSISRFGSRGVLVDNKIMILRDMTMLEEAVTMLT